MKVKGLDGRDYVLSLANKPSGSKSSYHLMARDLAKGIWGSYRIYEEVYLPGCSTRLYLDFFIPMLNIGIEVQGEQHFELVGKFHTNELDRAASTKRDRNKRAWCELNNITLVELPFNEDISQWKQRLMEV